MSRGTAILLAIIVVLVGLFAWLVPVIKQRMLGDSFSTKIEVLSVEEDEIEPVGIRTIVTMNIIFPIGNAPDKPQGNLFIRGEDGKNVEVDWPSPLIEDNYDKGTRKWTLTDVYLPINFRQGTLHNGVKDLCPVRLQEPKISPTLK